MADETITQRELGYKKEKQELSDIVKKFNKYYELIDEFCEPFMDDKEKIEKEHGIERVTNCFKELEEFYKYPEEVAAKLTSRIIKVCEQPEQNDLPIGGLYGKEMSEWRARISEKNPSSIFRSKELDRCGYNTVMLWALARKALNYNGMIDFIYNEQCNVGYADLCRSNEIKDNKQEILQLGNGYDYKEDKYLLKVSDIKKLQEELIEKLISLKQTSWRDAVFFWFRNCESREIVKEFEGSTNFVIEIGDDFMYAPSSFIIKTAEKGPGSLKSEKEMIDCMRKDIRTKEEDIFLSLPIERLGYFMFCSPYDYGQTIQLPQIAFFDETSNFEVLAMHKDYKSVEMTKSELNTEQREKCLGTIAYFLAHIHKHVPLSVSKKGKIDISDYIHKRLDNPFLELKDATKLKISENLTPILKCLADAPYALYKDAHPNNFLINVSETFFRITALDWEDKGFHPIYFDLVNFCEYSDFVTPKEKKWLLKEYVEAYNNNISRGYNYNTYKGEPNLEYGPDFNLSYLNAVIYRSICFSSAWSNPDREECKQGRGNMLNKAIGAINTIKKDHTFYYNKHKDNYDSLEEALKEIKILTKVK